MEGPCPKQLVVDIEDGNRDMHTRLDRCLQLVEQMAADRQLPHAYAGGRILEAYRTLQSYAQAGISYEQMIHTMRPEGLGDLRQLQQRAQLIQAGHDHVLNDKGWAVARNDYLRALYRHEKGSNVHSFKLSATFNEPLEHLVAMAREIDNVHHYDSILSGVVLDQPSLFEGSFYIGVKTPWPFKNMDFMLHAHGADLSEEHKCTVLMFGTPKSIPSDHLRKLPASAATCTRVTVLEGSCVLLRPLPPGPDGRPRTQGYMMVHLNPDLPSIPQLWIKLLLKVASPWLHGLVKGGLKTCFATPASVLSKRMAERPALYDLIRRRMSLF
ncbi:hypothetical protein WJX72_008151 [[Myrmecia] bisecta]|uniref:START domain-containing protein n=1 Tax=[Myrmecia] bisecta TaxID=41462 RepID=A0AAW1PGL2_9CHLO